MSDYTDQINSLEQRLATLEQSPLLKYSFPSSEVFLKSIELAGGARLIMENLAADPTVGRVGELAVVSRQLKICIQANPVQWEKIGIQT